MTKSSSTSSKAHRAITKKVKKASEYVPLESKNGKRGLFDKGIIGVCKQIDPNLSVSKRSMRVLNSVLLHLFELIHAEAIILLRSNEKKTLCCRAIQTATRLVMPGELAKHANSNGRRVVTRTDIGVYGTHTNAVGSEFLGASSRVASSAELRNIVHQLGGKQNPKFGLVAPPKKFTSHRVESIAMKRVKQFVEERYQEACSATSHTAEELADFKYEVSMDLLKAIVSNRDVNSLRHDDEEDDFIAQVIQPRVEYHFGARIDKIVIRRSCAYGKHINFHIDYALKTMQIALNEDTDNYEGGKLVYISGGKLMSPKRPFMSAIIHTNNIVHGVTEMVSGVKYGLFFLKLRGPDDRDSDEENSTFPPKPNSTGLVFKISTVRRLLKSRNNGIRIGAGAPIYLTAILEYITAELLELSGNYCIQCKKIRIQPSHLKFAIKNDEELNQLFGDFAIMSNKD